MVSLAERRVLYIRANDTIFRAPVAVGSGKTVVIDGVTKRFQTPRGKMAITHKEKDPVWVPPNWHYVEVARNNGLGIIDMSNASPNALGVPGGPGAHPRRQRDHPAVGGPRASTAASWATPSGDVRRLLLHGTDNERSWATPTATLPAHARDDIKWIYENGPAAPGLHLLKTGPLRGETQGNGENSLSVPLRLCVKRPLPGPTAARSPDSPVAPVEHGDAADGCTARPSTRRSSSAPASRTSCGAPPAPAP